MSPFYLKEGGERNSFKELGKRPRDIRGKGCQWTGVSTRSVKGEPEQIRVSVASNAIKYVLGERLNVVIFPGKTEVLNRSGFEVIDSATRKNVARVKYCEKPMGKR
jgi:hypothetical protein